MSFGHLISSLLILLSLPLCIVSERELGGLPFNLPTKFCSPCKSDASQYYRQTTIQDEICLRYTNKVQQPGSKVIFHLLQLLQAMDSTKSSFSYVVHAYIESMRIYQSLYKIPYDLSVLVIPTVDDSSCIKLFKSGLGFLRENTTRDYIRKTHPENFIQITSGRKWESIFLNGMEDIWSMAFCNNKQHKKYYQGAVQRVNDNSIQAHFWTLRPLGPFDTLNPIVNPAFFRVCGDNASIPVALAGESDRCQGQMECQLSNTRQDHLYAQIPPIQQSSGSRPRDRVDAAESMSEKATKKLKLENPTFVINEFNPLKSETLNQEEFIEIRVDPPPLERQVYFKTMKLIAIGVDSQRLLMVANLNKVPIPSNGYFVLQSSTLASKNYVHVSTDHHQFTLVPGFEKEPIALVLLNIIPTITASDWNRISLRRQRAKSAGAPRELHSKDLSQTSELPTWTIIRQTVVDMQMYGKILNRNIPDSLLSILPATHSGCNFIIPIGDVASSDDMQSSFNLCNPSPIVTPFKYQFIKLGSFTIGFENDCSRNLRYQVERSEHNEEIEVDTVGVTSIPSSEGQCPLENNLIGILQLQILEEIDRIIYKYDGDYTTSLYPTEKFKDTTWKEIINQQQLNLDQIPNLHPFELIKDTDFDPNAEDPTSRSKHFRCKICHQRIHECPDDHTHSQRQSRIAEKEPIPTNLAILKRTFFDHLDSQQHLTTVLYNVQRERMRHSADNEERVMSTAQPEIKELANVMDITYTFLHTNTAPFNAKSWYQTLTKIGASVGSSLHSQDTAYNIVDLIASIGTRNIFDYFIFKDHPFTLILDGSADSRNHHYVIVYMQALEGEKTIPFFVFLLKLGQTFTAISYRDALITEITAKGDSFVSYFKRRLVSIATDSASVMHSFQDVFSTWIGRKDAFGDKVNILGVYCLAHKLQLSSRNAIMPLKSDKDVDPESPLYYFSYLEKFMQSSYVWFKWSGKRIGLFRNMIEEEGLPKVEFKELHTERWISSEYRTVKNFVTAWKTARMSLDKMLLENSKQNKYREEIQSFEDKFRDRTAIITAHFVWDFTAAFKVWSEYLQKMAGLLMDQFKYFEQLNNNIAEMEAFNSPVLLSFLRNCVCDEIQGCTIDEYESATTVSCNGMLFDKTNPAAPRFRDAATELLRKVKQQLNKYIPWELLSTIYKLHPSQLPASKELLDIQYPYQLYPGGGAIRIYAEEEITTLAGMLGLFNNEIISDWQQLISSIVSSPNWKVSRQNSDSNAFWALQLRDKTIAWTVNTKLLIRSLKTIAPGSVACETGFSIFNNIKTKARMGLADSHVESIMKILINGPKTVTEFDSYYYATHWLTRGKTKPKPAAAVPPAICEGVPEKPFEILDDVEIDDTSSSKLFPFEVESLGYHDVYSLASLKNDFKENTKSKRTQSRIRSRIM